VSQIQGSLAAIQAEKRLLDTDIQDNQDIFNFSLQLAMLS